MSDKRIQLWSSGGGTQSAAIAALICMGKLRPDLSVIVDTEREFSPVWDYMDKWITPSLERVGVVLHRVPKSRYATVDLYGGKDGDTLLIPAFTDQSGKIGKLRTYCSSEWKKYVVRRWASEMSPPRSKFNTWIGFSTDEERRLYQEEGRWEPVFPLFDLRMDRYACVRIVEKMGWPTPPKSSCWMCPNRGHKAWQEMRDEHPEEFAKAVQFEKEIREKDEAMWLTGFGVPLDQIPKHTEEPDMFTGRCDSGYCFT